MTNIQDVILSLKDILPLAKGDGADCPSCGRRLVSLDRKSRFPRLKFDSPKNDSGPLEHETGLVMKCRCKKGALVVAPTPFHRLDTLMRHLFGGSWNGRHTRQFERVCGDARAAREATLALIERSGPALCPEVAQSAALGLETVRCLEVQGESAPVVADEEVSSFIDSVLSDRILPRPVEKALLRKLRFF